MGRDIGTPGAPRTILYCAARRRRRVGPLHRPYTDAMPHSLAALAAAACLAVTACAAEPPHDLRVQVHLAQPLADADAVARQASRIAGAPVKHVVANSADWHVLALECADDAACERALQRLRDATSTYRSVDVDQRRRVHAP